MTDRNADTTNLAVARCILPFVLFFFLNHAVGTVLADLLSFYVQTRVLLLMETNESSDTHKWSPHRFCFLLLLPPPPPPPPPRHTHTHTHYYYYWSLLYSAILRSRADSLRSHVILHEWIAFYSAFFEYPPKWCTYSAGMAGATRKCCHIGAFCVHHTTMHHVTSCKATYVRCMRV